MKIIEIMSDNYFSKTYPASLHMYDTDKIIWELKKFNENLDKRLISPLMQSNYMAWSNIPSETKIHERIKKGYFKIEDVNPHKIVTYQKEVFSNLILEAMKNENLGVNDGKLWNQYPLVKQFNGTDYLIDGNHRAVAALWSNRVLQSRIIDFDNFFEIDPYDYF